MGWFSKSDPKFFLSTVVPAGDGARVAQWLGVVNGEAIIGANIFRDLFSSVRDVVGGREAVEALLHDRLFAPLGMGSASPRFDSAGTFIGSSYVYATARDFARFGYLYLHGGVWAGRRVLSESWVDTTRDMHAVDPENGHGYSWHWWCWNADPRTIAALGYEGQRTIVDRDRELLVVHLGKWVAETQPILDGHLSSIIAAFPRR